MSDLFLILHKVRGEPAFDIAQQIQIGDELGWIIPTSGHRAYPSDYIQLARLQTNAGEVAVEHMAMPTDDWPDHYTCSREPNTPRKSLSNLLKKVMPKSNLRIRRINE